MYMLYACVYVCFGVYMHECVYVFMCVCVYVCGSRSSKIRAFLDFVQHAYNTENNELTVCMYVCMYVCVNFLCNMRTTRRIRSLRCVCMYVCMYV